MLNTTTTDKRSENIKSKIENEAKTEESEDA
jgi:hypothetical protein